MPRLEEAVVQSKTTDQDLDAALIAAAAKGDQKALAGLYDRYSPILLALGQRILGSRREAEDLLHDVFIEAWRRSKDYDGTRGTVRAWLIMRTRSRALDRVRARGRSKVVLGDDGRLPDRESHDDPSAAPDQTLVRDAVAALPDEQREVLHLAYFEGMTSSEIAAKIDIPIGTVKSRVARALRALRAQVLMEGDEK